MTRLLLAVMTALPLVTWWNVKGAPLDGQSGLRDVAAASWSDVWAVGHQGDRAAVEHWDGTKWSTHYIGDGLTSVSGVSVAAPDDVWAVGEAHGSAWAGHWDGSKWSSHQPLPDGEVNDVAVSGGRPWFVGSARWGMSAVLLGWSQSTGFYRVCDTPGTFRAVTMRKTVGEIWAVGTAANQPLIIRSTGTACVRSPAPAIRNGLLTRVWQVAKDDVWAVGHTDDSDDGPPSKPIVLHFDGKAWKRLAVPVATAQLTGLTSDASGAVWVSGVDMARPQQVLFLRYAAGAWSASYSEKLPYTGKDPLPVTETAITRIPGSTSLWAVATTRSGELSAEHILRKY